MTDATVDQDRLYATTDAKVWAEEFAKVCPDVDQGLMIGWFANAMVTAEMNGDKAAQASRLAVALVLTQEYLGSDVLPPIEGWAWYDALCDYYGGPFIPADQQAPADPGLPEEAVSGA